MICLNIEHLLSPKDDASGFILKLICVPSFWLDKLWCPVVESLSHVWLFVTPPTAACQASLSFTISQSLLKLMSILSVMSSNYLILCRPLLLLPSIFPRIRVFPMSQLFASRGQSIGVSATASVFSMTSYGIVVFFKKKKKTNQHLSVSVKYISLLLLICFYS